MLGWVTDMLERKRFHRGSLVGRSGSLRRLLRGCRLPGGKFLGFGFGRVLGLQFGLQGGKARLLLAAADVLQLVVLVQRPVQVVLGGQILGDAGLGIDAAVPADGVQVGGDNLNVAVDLLLDHLHGVGFVLPAAVPQAVEGQILPQTPDDPVIVQLDALPLFGGLLRLKGLDLAVDGGTGVGDHPLDLLALGLELVEGLEVLFLLAAAGLGHGVPQLVQSSPVGPGAPDGVGRVGAALVLFQLFGHTGPHLIVVPDDGLDLPLPGSGYNDFQHGGFLFQMSGNTSGGHSSRCT